MHTTEIIIVITGFCILAASIAARSFIVPHNRNRSVEDVLDILHKPRSISHNARGSAPACLPSESLGEGLLRHFTQSWLSCRIVDILAASDNGMREADIVGEVNALVVESGKRPLPEVAVRKVLMILVGADFVIMRDGALSLTTLGRHLHSVLNERRRPSHEPIRTAS